ncbi:MAG: TauD/TfdA family dioxygenase [Betaproteobacteria bacterium]|nr:TauD/TfdA family dioxygenase [Betaproteobacteria bacterium]
MSAATAQVQQSSRLENTLAALEVIPTGAAVGAEIRGVNLALAAPDDVGAALRKAWADHGVLLFRGQDIDDDQLVAAAEIFGGVQETGGRKYYLAAGRGVKDHRIDARHHSISVISNLDENGNPVKHNGGLGSYEVVWHSDNSYVEVPPAGSMLYALEIPPTGGGGETSFNNQYLAYEELADDLKNAIRGKYQRHDSSRNSAGVLRPGANLPKTLDEVEGPVHPLVRIHPVTRKPALYLGRRRVWPSNHIIGMADAESEALLDKLWAHATQPKYAWTHQWRVGDLVLWDNQCCMHYRTEIDTNYRRVMHRTVIKGDPVIPAW